MAVSVGDGTRFDCKGPNCSATKKQVNNWWVLWVMDGEFHANHFDEALIRKLAEAGIQAKWVCGIECAAKVFMQYLGGTE